MSTWLVRRWDLIVPQVGKVIRSAQTAKHEVREIDAKCGKLSDTNYTNLPREAETKNGSERCPSGTITVFSRPNQRPSAGTFDNSQEETEETEAGPACGTEDCLLLRVLDSPKW